jgi:hypothetical protein
MAAIVLVARSSDYANQWKVALDGRYVVGFDGPNARDQAEQHRDVLEELLKVQDEMPLGPIAGRP